MCVRRGYYLPTTCLVLLTLSIGAVWAISLISGAVTVGSSARDYELGSVADYQFDREGRLSIADVTSPRQAGAFVATNGRPANYGASPTPRAALWLRIAVPDLPTSAENDWILSLNEVRVTSVELFIPDNGSWRKLIWNDSGRTRSSQAAIRYPVISVSRDEVSGKTVYLRMKGRSSLRATVRLQTDLAFASGYGADNFLFGIASGILAMLVFYLTANGFAASDRTILLLAAFAATYLLYILTHQAFLEVHIIPGGLFVSRILSILTSNLIFAWWLLFTDAYLRVQDHRPLLSKVIRIAAGFCIVFAIAAATGVLLDALILRRLTPIVGISALVLGVVATLITIRDDAHRAWLFLLCWSLGLLAGILRMAHDLVPALGANPYALNATYLATCLCFVIFGIVTSIEIQQRERRSLPKPLHRVSRAK